MSVGVRCKQWKLSVRGDTFSNLRIEDERVVRVIVG